MMKNKRNILFILAFSLLTPACSDYLDIRPENQLLLDDFWKKESDVEAVVLTCYSAMTEADFMSRVMLWGELRSDNVTPSEGAGDVIKQINNAIILPTYDLCTWSPMYKVINYCNTVLKYAPEVEKLDPNFTTADLQAKEAEVLAIRALCYFYLVRSFRDIPLSLEATVSDDQNLVLSQSSPDVVLKKITDDLLLAETWALSVYPTKMETKGRMTKDAIRALLADVYLWRKDYANCITYCDKLINATTYETNMSGGKIEVPKYELIKDLSTSSIFAEGNSSESIFELQFSTLLYNGAVSSLYGNPSTVGTLIATTSYANPESELIFPKTDERKADFIITKKTDAGAYQIFKYLGSRMSSGTGGLYSFKQTTANWIFYRITDVMLMKAEALVQLQESAENLVQALHIVNMTYMRANTTLLSADTLAFDAYKSVEGMEKLVLLERQRELMFEGKRWFDLVRAAERKNTTTEIVDYLVNKYTTNQSTIISKLSVMNSIYLPIPEGELMVNDSLKQNPYYEVSTNIHK